MDVAKYRQLYLDECREHLQGLNRELLAMEQGGGSVDEMFRSAHSIKGMSGSMGFDDVVRLAHALEDVLDGFRKEGGTVRGRELPLLFEAVDTLGALVDQIEEQREGRLDVEAIVGRLREASKEDPRQAAGGDPPRTGPSKTEGPGETVEAGAGPPDPAAPGAGEEREPRDLEEAAPERPDGGDPPGSGPGEEPAGGMEAGASLAGRDPAGGPPEAETAPVRTGPAEELVAARGEIYTLEPEKLAMVRDFVRSGMEPYGCRLRVSRDSAALGARNFIILSRLAKAGMLLASAPTIEEVRGGGSREVVEALLLTERPEEQLRALLLSIPELEELELRHLRIGPESPTPGGPAPGGPALLQQREAVVDRPPGQAGGLADRYAPKRASTVRVDTRVLDDLINIVGELIITRERLQEIGRDLESDELHMNLDRLHTLVRDFQDSIMTVRMMPLELVTDRLPRVVRDLGFNRGRKVALEVAGKGIELDRAILEELSDVLIHLVRNAIDHGIEDPAQRRAAGKPEKALLRVRAGRERDWVWVRVEDDGRGMDPEAIARAAVARGVVDAEKAAALSDREKLMLCCFPGVSTAERVTDVSGRGVGMDVVKAKIDAFGGALQIDSRPGRGTAITMRLPLTLAIIRILLVGVRGQEYGLPVSHVMRTAPLEPADVEWSQRRPLVRHGGRLVPLLDLGALLGLPPRDLRLTSGAFVALAEFGDRAAGLAVDRLLGTFEVVIKPLGPPLKRVRGLGGVTVMGDGRTVLLLDLAALI